jgi:hypothetical protein
VYITLNLDTELDLVYITLNLYTELVSVCHTESVQSTT